MNYTKQTDRKEPSAQDEYAKWTKLNRQADKLSAELQKLNQEIQQQNHLLTKLATH